MCRKEGKGSRQRGGHPFPFSLALLLVTRFLAAGNSNNSATPISPTPPWFTTPHRWHRVCLRPLTNHFHCALFLGCATGAGKNIPSHASPPTISVCGTRKFFSPGAALPQTKYPNAYYHCNVPCIQSRCPSSHRIYSSYQQISPYNFYLSTQLFCSNTCLVHRSQ